MEEVWPRGYSGGAESYEEVENFLIRTYGNFLDMLKVLVTSRPRDLCSNVLRSQVPT